jgi:hypothetical protein
MHLQQQQFAISAAGTLGAIYIVCSIFVALFPDLSSVLMGWLTHLVNIEGREVTWVGFFGGLIQVVLYTYLAAWLFALLHNRAAQ